MLLGRRSRLHHPVTGQSPTSCPLPLSTSTERALDTYCALHRLLLALCDRHGLWGAAERRVQGFLSSSARRSKEAVPSLGALIPLLAVSRCHEWQEVSWGGKRGCCGRRGLIGSAGSPHKLAPPQSPPHLPFSLQVMHLLLNEAVDRQVLWVCKGDQGLVARYKRSPKVGGVDPQLLDGFFKHSTIALRWVQGLPGARPPLGQPKISSTAASEAAKR